MGNFHYFMPTDCYFGRGCVAEHKAAMAKLGKNENVTTDVLVKICTALQCDIGDIMELTKDVI